MSKLDELGGIDNVREWVDKEHWTFEARMHPKNFILALIERVEWEKLERRAELERLLKIARDYVRILEEAPENQLSSHDRRKLNTARECLKDWTWAKCGPLRWYLEHDAEGQ